MDRSAVEARLERFVREHRATIAVIFPLVGAVTLVASAEALLPSTLAFNAWLLLFGTLVMRLPLAGALAPLIDRRAAAWLGLLAAYAYTIEYVGLRFGWPYGEFAYGIELGPMVGGVPLGLPVFFIPLVVNAYLLALLLSRDRRLTIPLAIGLVLVIDLVLDPAAVAIGFWTYPAGTYYGVPASNYLGWLLSGAVAVLTIDRAFDRTALLTRLETVEFAMDDLVSFVLLWSAVNALNGQWVAVLLAGLLGVGLVGTDRVGLPSVCGAITRRAS